MGHGLALYSLTIVNVGLDISFSRLKYDKIPSVNFVFPDPSYPVSIMMSPCFNLLASFLAKLFVSFSLLVINLYCINLPLFFVWFLLL